MNSRKLIAVMSIRDFNSTIDPMSFTTSRKLFMLYKKTNPTMIMFGTLLIALCSAISTTIFSESAFNDNASISITVFAGIGLTLTAAKLLFDAIHSICNP